MAFRASAASALLFFLLPTATAAAQQPACPCFPNQPVWIVEPCETWNCAASRLVMANGDPFVLALPTNTATYRWVVLRRTAQGGVVVHPENPFEVEIFQSTAEGSARFDSLPPTLAPALVTTTDGKTLVVRLKHPEGRTAPRR